MVLIALGTFSMFYGNRISSKERDALLRDQIQGTIVNESDIQIVIGNLTMPEKYFLRHLVKHPKNMTQSEIWRMLKSYAENIKPPFPPGYNPFQETLDSLLRKKIITYANDTATITPYGRMIVQTIIKNKVPPFDFDLDK